jgi:hypothetical protein
MTDIKTDPQSTPKMLSYTLDDETANQQPTITCAFIVEENERVSITLDRKALNALSVRSANEYPLEPHEKLIINTVNTHKDWAKMHVKSPAQKVAKRINEKAIAAVRAEQGWDAGKGLWPKPKVEVTQNIDVSSTTGTSPTYEVGDLDVYTDMFTNSVGQNAVRFTILEGADLITLVYSHMALSDLSKKVAVGILLSRYDLMVVAAITENDDWDRLKVVSPEVGTSRDKEASEIKEMGSH